MTLKQMSEGRQEFRTLVTELLKIEGLQEVYSTPDVVRLKYGDRTFDLHWEEMMEGWAVRVDKHPTIGFDKKLVDNCWVARLGTCFLPFIPQIIVAILTPQFSYEGCLEQWPILAGEQ